MSVASVRKILSDAAQAPNPPAIARPDVSGDELIDCMATTLKIRRMRGTTSAVLRGGAELQSGVERHGAIGTKTSQRAVSSHKTSQLDSLTRREVQHFYNKS